MFADRYRLYHPEAEAALYRVRAVASGHRETPPARRPRFSCSPRPGRERRSIPPTAPPRARRQLSRAASRRSGPDRDHRRHSVSHRGAPRVPLPPPVGAGALRHRTGHRILRGPRRARPRGGPASGATLVDLSDTVCPDDPCPVIVEGVIAYQDRVHRAPRSPGPWPAGWRQRSRICGRARPLRIMCHLGAHAHDALYSRFLVRSHPTIARPVSHAV